MKVGVLRRLVDIVYFVHYVPSSSDNAESTMIRKGEMSVGAENRIQLRTMLSSSNVIRRFHAMRRRRIPWRTGEAKERSTGSENETNNDTISSRQDQETGSERRRGERTSCWRSLATSKRS